MGVSGRVGVKGGALLFFVCMAVAALASVMYAPQAHPPGVLSRER